MNRTIQINVDALKAFSPKTPQVLVLKDMLLEVGKRGTATEDKINEVVNSAKWVAALKTKQAGSLIFRYYRNVLEQAGVIVVPNKRNVVQQCLDSITCSML